jgi:hypothetical protein
MRDVNLIFRNPYQNTFPHLIFTDIFRIILFCYTALWELILSFSWNFGVTCDMVEMKKECYLFLL